MVVYADVLIVINIIVNYFILLVADRILKNNSSVKRLIFGAAVGSIGSLYIFLPQNPAVVELIFKILICMLIVFCAFGYKSFKGYIRNISMVLFITFIYAGGMLAVWYIFKPNGMVINNSVVYFNISPLFLIGFSVAGYFICLIFKSCFSKSNIDCDVCEITVMADYSSINLIAIVDTGNSLEDFFGKSEIIIVDPCEIKNLFGDYKKNDRLKSRYRAMPCSTVSGTELLEGYRCDKAYVKHEDKTIELNNPILAISKVKLNDGYTAIINPKILF